MPKAVRIGAEDAFEIYLQMGDERSLRGLVQVINERYGDKTVSKSTIERWSRAPNENGLVWRDRVKKYEVAVSAATHRKLVTDAIYDRAEAIRAFKGIGGQLLDRVIDFITGKDESGNWLMPMETTLDVKRAMEVVKMVEREVAWQLGLANPDEPDEDESAPGDEVDTLDGQLKKLDNYRAILERQKALAEEKAARAAKEAAGVRVT